MSLGNSIEMHLSKEADTLGYKGTVKTPDNDYLQHWKYIKRERVNGTWRYWYDYGKDAKREAGNAQSKLRDAANNAGFHAKRYNEVKSKVESGEYFDKDKGNDSIIKPYRDDYAKALSEYEDAKVRAYNAQAAYAKTPLSKIENAKAKVDAGKKAVAKFLDNTKEVAIDKINSTADKGKKWLEDLLKIR